LRCSGISGNLGLFLGIIGIDIRMITVVFYSSKITIAELIFYFILVTLMFLVFLKQFTISTDNAFSNKLEIALRNLNT